ncbi:MAG: hypothetical protein A3C08_01470 [Candidatus Taylorbacteria bacterium RIFCSPHIGHO2_02_FULL_47_18]|uniref:Band 7 domain-containing protein n=1 Tax=Candidatus Taylorbacteria bacterium RIFCSPLOWO2_01_FULL_48_100 TaxID=1802322 RepID=A0A1G2NE84_9BACT|nr:MAG: hypothetical protein A2670_01520 [Candidatus Taylorbacteria bacterium RIFCSPHIGHO2_01_FULL_48_38]OHA28423.1 MAG: hypothetical protein A3C08_01470 [Candidatus Taylorbacteria bacterium RIFCSPHIGHO2_02_FULL_47_18]OHA34395.1 MAG: hypothetical protein A2938_00900 [Candidatus Taylorbacteria bacterium RIFCSPLOWO2_01_FULL_48_100]OHA40178.1 MAG: hypothetical protein A3J31_01180 [Candidatus Taylorbacteria bacterium RIFCSPLOWO2_02_FULL_48_16]OHA45487.1 MAG: hypothetical protein A3H13_01665 [Candid
MLETIVGLLILIPLIVLFLYNAAKNKQQATFVDQDTIEFIVKGGKLDDVLENIDGWHYQQKNMGWLYVREANKNATGKLIKGSDGKPTFDEKHIQVSNAIVRTGEVKDTTGAVLGMNKKEKKRPLAELCGFYWVSVLYPLWKIHKFKVVHLRIRPDTAVPENAPIEKWLDSSVHNQTGDTTEETSLLWKFPRPVLVRDVEFLDLFEASVLLQNNFQIVKPQPIVFTYRERFFSLLEQVIQAAVIDYLRKYPGGYEAFIKLGVTGSQSDFFWEALDPLNYGPRGLIEEFGVYLIDSRVVQIQLSKLDDTAAKALKAKKIAELEGDAEVMKAEKHAKAITTVATADAAALTSQITATGVTTEILQAKFAVDIARLNIEKADKIKTGVTWVEGGAIQINK